MEPLTIVYKHDYDIIACSKRIIGILNDQYRVADGLQKEIEELRTKIRNTFHLNEKMILIERVKKLEVGNGNRVDDYKRDIKEVLAEYEKLPKVNHKIGFGLQDEYDEITPERATIINRFFDITNKYFPVNVFYQVSVDRRCPNCQADVSDIVRPMDGQILVCDCGYHVNIFSYVPGDITGDYKDRENFEKMLVNYQGLEDITLPPDLFSKLDGYFRDNKMPIGDDIKKKRKEGKNIELSYRSLRTALGKIKYANLYDHIWLIAHEYWDTPLANVRYLHDLIMRDYDLTEHEFKKIKGKERKASLNTKWRLHRHLVNRGHHPPSDAFKDVETRDIVEYYERTWEQMCKGANDPDIKYIKSL